MAPETPPVRLPRLVPPVALRGTFNGNNPESWRCSHSKVVVETQWLLAKQPLNSWVLKKGQRFCVQMNWSQTDSLVICDDATLAIS